MEGLEMELNDKLLEKKGIYALKCTRIAGAVYVEAISSGVPSELAQDMSTDTWVNLMGIPAVTTQEEQ